MLLGFWLFEDACVDESLAGFLDLICGPTLADGLGYAIFCGDDETTSMDVQCLC